MEQAADFAVSMIPANPSASRVAQKWSFALVFTRNTNSLDLFPLLEQSGMNPIIRALLDALAISCVITGLICLIFGLMAVVVAMMGPGPITSSIVFGRIALVFRGVFVILEPITFILTYAILQRIRGN
jgi:hypothetical protein